MNEPLIFVLCLAYFVVMWCATVAGISFFSGWHKAAKKYVLNGETAETVHRFCSARIGKASYGCCLSIGTNGEGMILRLIPPFAFAHKPLFIPYRAITVTAQTRFTAAKSVVLSVAECERFTIEITESLAKRVLPDSLYVPIETTDA